MRDDMVERVAKAIRLRDTTDEYAMARAAIEAMLEPTDGMHVAMCACYSSPATIWMTGIRSALGYRSITEVKENAIK